jgi:hypothetical protein
MAGSGDRAELERRLHSYRDVNQWWPLNYTKTFVDDRSDLSHLTESVGLSGRYYTQLAEKSPRLIAGRGCGTAATLKNTGFSAQEARAIAANVIHYGRPSIRGGHPVQWVNFSLHQESTQEIIFRSTAEVMAIFLTSSVSSAPSTSASAARRAAAAWLLLLLLLHPVPLWSPLGLTPPPSRSSASHAAQNHRSPSFAFGRRRRRVARRQFPRAALAKVGTAAVCRLAELNGGGSRGGHEFREAPH